MLQLLKLAFPKAGFFLFIYNLHTIVEEKIVMWSYEEAKELTRMVGQVNAFATDASDEFSVQRENGQQQGIFKTWSIPIIPFLDAGNIAALSQLWPDLAVIAEGAGFEAALHQLANSPSQAASLKAQEALITIKEWRERCKECPSYLERSMEKARLFSWIIDKRLTTIFASEPLSDDLSERITQLVNRLYLALGLMSPFYHVEAIAGDPQLLSVSGGNLERRNERNGVLDVVAFLLPAALKDVIIAGRGNWNGLNWRELRKQTKKCLANARYAKILLGVSRLAGIPPHHVLFAANALEWIPAKVGGKKEGGVSPTEALTELEAALSQSPKNGDMVSALAETNALIRFLNWVPLIESEKNFEGLQWTYGSVCDSGNLLAETLSRNLEVWEDGFASVFVEFLKPQLDGLDASSAKGRFFLHIILKESRLKKEFFGGIDERWRENVIRATVQPSKNGRETEKPTRHIYPHGLVGGKPFRLALAASVIFHHHIPDGFVLSTSEVETFLKSSALLWEKILKLDRSAEEKTKIILAREIRRIIMEQSADGWLHDTINREISNFPQVQLWAVRSSSLNEGEARGVYRTFLRIPKERCVKMSKKCVASYYSRKAVLFRLVHKMGDIPHFAVFLTPYRKATGGVAAIEFDGKEKKYRVSTGVTAAKATAGIGCVQEWTGHFGEQGINNQKPAVVSDVARLLQKLESRFGKIQIEWLKNSHQIMLLQMETLPATTPEAVSPKNNLLPTCSFKMNSVKEVQYLETFLKENEGGVTLNLGKEMNLNSFTGELFALIVRFGQRIIEVRTENCVSPSCHFANICRYFAIKISS